MRTHRNASTTSKFRSSASMTPRAPRVVVYTWNFHRLIRNARRLGVRGCPSKHSPPATSSSPWKRSTPATSSSATRPPRPCTATGLNWPSRREGRTDREAEILGRGCQGRENTPRQPDTRRPGSWPPTASMGHPRHRWVVAGYFGPKLSPSRAPGGSLVQGLPVVGPGRRCSRPRRRAPGTETRRGPSLSSVYPNGETHQSRWSSASSRCVSAFRRWSMAAGQVACTVTMSPMSVATVSGWKTASEPQSSQTAPS